MDRVSLLIALFFCTISFVLTLLGAALGPFYLTLIGFVLSFISITILVKILS